jgi:UDP-N-acetyl-2-amino-2-deoxyglucuronate dehydrogenase
MAFSHTRHRTVIRDFVEAVRDSRPHAITGDEALTAQLVIDAIMRSSAERRAIRFDEVAAPLHASRK